MSVCRFFWGGSQVYIYYSDQGVECCGCCLGDGQSAVFDEDLPQEMVAHLEEHVAAGHVVPEIAFKEFGATHPNPESLRAARKVWEEASPVYTEGGADE